VPKSLGQFLYAEFPLCPPAFPIRNIHAGRAVFLGVGGAFQTHVGSILGVTFSVTVSSLTRHT